MPTNISEINLENTILAYLRDKQGYERQYIAVCVTGQINV